MKTLSNNLKLLAILITISLMATIFMQVSWIKNAAKLKKEQFHENVQHALIETTNDINFTKDSLKKSGGIYYQMQNPLYNVEKIFNTEQVRQLLIKNLKKNGINISRFEFCIVNRFGLFVINSDGFEFDYLNKSFNQALTNDFINSEEIFLYIYQTKDDLMKSITWMLLASLLFTSIIIITFYLTFNTLLNQKKLSELKTNFINNMTHEFKTPLATISLAVDALKNPKVKVNEEKQDYYTDIIKEENKRMNNHVEKILQTAKLEKSTVKLNLEEFYLNQMLNELGEKFELQIQNLNGSVVWKLDAKKDKVYMDKFHTENIFSNIIDNAIKYTKPDVPLKLKIESENNANQIIIKISDNGLGMNRETLNNIFEKFFRANTGNIHNVKGFGLGLAYAKDMVEIQNGKIKAESQLEKGSTFIVSFPISE